MSGYNRLQNSVLKLPITRVPLGVRLQLVTKQYVQIYHIHQGPTLLSGYNRLQNSIFKLPINTRVPPWCKVTIGYKTICSNHPQTQGSPLGVWLQSVTKWKIYEKN